MRRQVTLYPGVVYEIERPTTLRLLSAVQSATVEIESSTPVEEVGTENPGLLMRAMERRGMRAGK